MAVESVATVAMTSISPKHAVGDAQLQAVKSWQSIGLKVLSFNSPSEIGQLKDRYEGIEFVPAHLTMEGVQKVPYVPIQTFIEYAKKHGIEQVMLINSDIEIRDTRGLIDNYCGRAKDGLIFANREDHNGDAATARRYEHGFDVFIVHSKYYHLLTASMFCMGQTWWDFWVPYKYIMAGIPVSLVKEPLFFHRSHPVQYDGGEWTRMTQHFQWLVRKWEGRTPQYTTQQVYHLIKQKAR